MDFLQLLESAPVLPNAGFSTVEELLNDESEGIMA